VIGRAETMTDLVFFVCDCVSWRLDVFEGALAKALKAIHRADEDARLILAYRTRDDSALLVVSSQDIPAVLLADLVLGNAPIPGLRRLPLDGTGISASTFIRQRLASCEVSAHVTDVEDAINRIRSVLGMGTDRRVARRLSVSLPVRMKLADGDVDVWSGDVSAGGIFIRGEIRPELKARVEIEFFPESEQPLPAEVVVVRHTSEGFGGTLDLSYEAQRELYRRLRMVRAPLPTVAPDLIRCWPTVDDFVSVRGEATPEAFERALTDAVRSSPNAMPRIKTSVATARQQLVVPQPAPTPPPNARVLLALGLESVRKPLARQLTQAGCEAIEARTTEEVFQILADEILGLDLLVLDSTIPGTTAEDLVFRIRELGGETELPIVLFTDASEEERERLLLNEGMTQVLPISVPTEALAASLISLVADHRRAALA